MFGQLTFLLDSVSRAACLPARAAAGAYLRSAYRSRSPGSADAAHRVCRSSASGIRRGNVNLELSAAARKDLCPWATTVEGTSTARPLAGLGRLDRSLRLWGRHRQHHHFHGTPPRPRHALGRLPTPPPLPENLLLRLHRKLPSEPPASTTCKPHSSRERGRLELGPSRLRDHGLG